MLDALWFFGRHLAAFALLAATVFMAGWLPARRLAASELERAALAPALGLTLLAHLALVLGLCGLLRPGPLAVAALATHAVGYREWRALAWRAAERLRATPRRTLALAAGGGLLLVLPFLALALYPPVAFDETLYHLPFARAFARSGGLPFLPELRVPVFPQLGDLLLALMLIAAGDVATHLVAVLATLATAALLLAWGRRDGVPGAGPLAAGLWLGTPMVAYLAGTAYIDPPLALFSTAAFFAADRYRASASPGWAAVAAALAASAAGTKYLGLFVLAVVGVALALVALRERSVRRLRDLALAGLVVAALLALSYGRILRLTGNPLFPFYPDTFGTTWWSPPEAAGGGGALGRLGPAAALPWQTVFDRAAVGRQPPLSPWLLLGLPLLVAAVARSPRARAVLAIAVTYLLAVPVDVRYLLPVLPLLCLGVAETATRLLARRRRGVATIALAALAVLAVLPGWLYAGWRLARQGPAPATAEARERWLDERLPLHPAVREVDRRYGAAVTIYGVHAENMVYFARGRLLGDWNGPASYARVLSTIRDPALFHRKLRSLGVDVLLVAKGKAVGLPPGAAAEALFRKVYEDDAATVYELR